LDQTGITLMVTITMVRLTFEALNWILALPLTSVALICKITDSIP
jgi:hypothetical protein